MKSSSWKFVQLGIFVVFFIMYGTKYFPLTSMVADIVSSLLWDFNVAINYASLRSRYRIFKLVKETMWLKCIKNKTVCIKKRLMFLKITFFQIIIRELFQLFFRMFLPSFSQTIHIHILLQRKLYLFYLYVSFIITHLDDLDFSYIK